MNNFNDEANRIWDVFVGWIPHLLSAVIAFLVGWLISVLLKSVIASILNAFGLNRKIEKSKAEGVIHKMTNDPSESIARFVYWLAMSITILVAVSYLKIPVINEFIVRIYNYIPNIVGAIFILLVALAISAVLSGFVIRWMGETVTGKVIGAVVPVIILSVAGFAILEQLRVAPVIISTTYIAIISTLSLASALAFGLGGRDVANRILESAYEKGARSVEQAKQDIKVGQAKAKEDAERARSQI